MDISDDTADAEAASTTPPSPVAAATHKIVLAYVGNGDNDVTPRQVVRLARDVVGALRACESVGDARDGLLTCLEDGRRLESLPTHLRVAHGLSPDQYRRKWGLPDDHPLEAEGRRTTRRGPRARQAGQGDRPTGQAL